MIELITWNIKKDEELLRRALKLLDDDNPVVLCLQETPFLLEAGGVFESEAPDSAVIHSQFYSNYWHRHTAILSNGLVGMDSRTDPEGKLVAVTLELPGYGQVDIIAIHAISHATEDNERLRLERARTLRKSLSEVRKRHSAILLGDFNADPFDCEMWGVDNMYALRDKKLVAHYAEREPSIHDRPWWNPSWSLLSDCSTDSPAGGTYYYQTRKKHSHWYLFDQVVVSSDLSISVSGISILSDVSGPLREEGLPGPWKFLGGDHLPVSLHLH